VGNEKEKRSEIEKFCPGEKIKIQIYSDVASTVSNFDCGVIKRASTGEAPYKEQSSGRT
jgi:hypothetical protein